MLVNISVIIFQPVIPRAHREHEKLRFQRRSARMRTQRVALRLRDSLLTRWLCATSRRAHLRCPPLHEALLEQRCVECGELVRILLVGRHDWARVVRAEGDQPRNKQRAHRASADLLLWSFVLLVNYVVVV